VRGAPADPALDHLTLSLEVTLRRCVAEDLPLLEWEGMFTAHRELTAEAWRRHQLGENVMLVAEAQRSPIGQIWVDLTRKGAQSIGFLWALRVRPGFQRLGLGGRLLAAAERVVLGQGLRVAEIGAEQHNPGARRLYERCGYRVVAEELNAYEYTTPEGRSVRMAAPQWVLHKTLTTGQELPAP
jgi:GNAT superfamily N-acetyltransferase